MNKDAQTWIFKNLNDYIDNGETYIDTMDRDISKELYMEYLDKMVILIVLILILPFTHLLIFLLVLVAALFVLFKLFFTWINSIDSNNTLLLSLFFLFDV
jgi:hypothetical protein